MRKYAMGFVLTLSLFMAALVGVVTTTENSTSKAPETAVTQPVSVTCGAQQDTPVDAVTLPASMRLETVRARVYWRRCWDGNGGKWVDPIAVRGGYEYAGGDIGCGGNLRLDGYRFNFGDIGGYNVPTFFVDHQDDCGNHKTINIQDESKMIPSYSLGNCWGAHITQVWNFANDIERNLSGCMNY